MDAVDELEGGLLCLEAQIVRSWLQFYQEYSVGVADRDGFVWVGLGVYWLDLLEKIRR